MEKFFVNRVSKKWSFALWFEKFCVFTRVKVLGIKEPGCDAWTEREGDVAQNTLPLAKGWRRWFLRVFER